MKQYPLEPTLKLLNHLRHNGIKADKDYLQRKIKGQMKQTV